MKNGPEGPFFMGRDAAYLAGVCSACKAVRAMV